MLSMPHSVVYLQRHTQYELFSKNFSCLFVSMYLLPDSQEITEGAGAVQTDSTAGPKYL